MIGSENLLSTRRKGQHSIPRMTPKRRRWLEAFLGEAEGNATEAARIAGYDAPGVVGIKLRREFVQEIELSRLNAEEARIVGARETLVILSEIARDKQHKDRKAAADTLAKIHGLMADKVSISLDRKQLLTDLEGVLVALAPLLLHEQKVQQSLEPAIDVESTSTPGS